MSEEKNSEENVVREFLKYERMLREFIRSLISNWHDAEDVFQETAVVILKKGNSDEAIGFFPQWCRSIARNMVRNYWRKKGRARLDLWEDFSQVAEESYSERDADIEALNGRRRLMDLCVELLPPASKTMLKMFHLERIASEEIARRLKRTPGAIRVALMRIRESIRSCVELKMAGLK